MGGKGDRITGPEGAVQDKSDNRRGRVTPTKDAVGRRQGGGAPDDKSQEKNSRFTGPMVFAEY